MELKNPTAEEKLKFAPIRPTLYTYVEMTSEALVLSGFCIRYIFSKAHAHNAAQTQNQHDNRDWNECREVDVPYFPKP